MRDFVTMTILLIFLILTGMLRIDYVLTSVAVTKIEEEKGPTSAIWITACREQLPAIVSFDVTARIYGAEEVQ